MVINQCPIERASSQYQDWIKIGLPGGRWDTPNQTRSLFLESQNCSFFVEERQTPGAGCWGRRLEGVARLDKRILLSKRRARKGQSIVLGGRFGHFFIFFLLGEGEGGWLNIFFSGLKCPSSVVLSSKFTKNTLRWLGVSRENRGIFTN